jgi:hypothetical protein
MLIYKKYVHENGELLVQDEVQEAALISEGFKFKELVDKDGNKVDENGKKIK